MVDVHLVFDRGGYFYCVLTESVVIGDGHDFVVVSYGCLCFHGGGVPESD